MPELHATIQQTDVYLRVTKVEHKTTITELNEHVHLHLLEREIIYQGSGTPQSITKTYAEQTSSGRGSETFAPDDTPIYAARSRAVLNDARGQEIRRTTDTLLGLGEDEEHTQTVGDSTVTFTGPIDDGAATLILTPEEARTVEPAIVTQTIIDHEDNITLETRRLGPSGLADFVTRLPEPLPTTLTKTYDPAPTLGAPSVDIDTDSAARLTPAAIRTRLLDSKGQEITGGLSAVSHFGLGEEETLDVTAPDGILDFGDALDGGDRFLEAVSGSTRAAEPVTVTTRTFTDETNFTDSSEKFGPSGNVVVEIPFAQSGASPYRNTVKLSGDNARLKSSSNWLDMTVNDQWVLSFIFSLDQALPAGAKWFPFNAIDPTNGAGLYVQYLQDFEQLVVGWRSNSGNQVAKIYDNYMLRRGLDYQLTIVGTGIRTSNNQNLFKLRIARQDVVHSSIISNLTASPNLLSGNPTFNAWYNGATTYRTGDFDPRSMLLKGVYYRRGAVTTAEIDDIENKGHMKAAADYLAAPDHLFILRDSNLTATSVSCEVDPAVTLIGKAGADDSASTAAMDIIDTDNTTAIWTG